MVKVTAEEVWSMNPQQLAGLLQSQALVATPRNVRFYAPSFSYYKTSMFCSFNAVFPTVSVTGNACNLNCKHCGGKILQTMYAAKTPQKLKSLCLKLKYEGAKGVLVSGGCLPDGSVPLGEFTGALAEAKRLGLTVFVHTGILVEEAAAQLKAAGVDAALIDIIGNNDTIREVYNLKTTTSMYEQSLEALSKVGLPFVPHIVAGLHHGQLLGELAALKMAASYKPSAVVIVSFMPIRGTIMEKTKPPTPIDIAKTVAAARAAFSNLPVVLGCMRPKGTNRSETDVLALKAGVDGVAFPSEEAIRYAKENGYAIAFSHFCCAQIYADLTGN